MGDTFAFSEDDTRLLAAVLDEVIPAAGGMPAAGAIGLVADIERALRQNPAPAVPITQGLATLPSLGDFLAAGKAQRVDLLKQLESREPGFVPTLMFLGYAAYYQHPRVLAALGREARPPHPKGYEMEPDDLSLLEPVRRRGKMYRQA